MHITVEASQVQPGDYIYNLSAKKLPAAFHWVRVIRVVNEGRETTIYTHVFNTTKHSREAVAVRRSDRSDCICDNKSHRPALEHSNGCPVKESFFGGDPAWDKSKEHVKGGTTYHWVDDFGGTWRPIFDSPEH